MIRGMPILRPMFIKNSLQRYECHKDLVLNKTGFTTYRFPVNSGIDCESEIFRHVEFDKSVVLIGTGGGNSGSFAFTRLLICAIIGVIVVDSDIVVHSFSAHSSEKLALYLLSEQLTSPWIIEAITFFACLFF
ncbi:Hypothetical predicted protein [Octopus vulgaris]|uniref:Uncharacterized protein n=1 Tax=Octopus vulgaris TaxID=6645 RepID=A0AA36EUW3_OCTVU|nr:Hypothetical predicted protein [Octopus vulgaris]